MESIKVTVDFNGKRDYFVIRGENIKIERRNEETGEYEVYKIERDIIDRERRKEKIIAKRRMVNLIEDNGGIPEGMSKDLVYKCIKEGIEAQEEEFEIMGEDAFYLEPGTRV